MATVITDDQVRAVITPVMATITAQREAAQAVVDERLADTGQSAQILTLIAVYLAAHFISVSEPRAKSQKIGDASETFQGETGRGFDATLYGQTAMDLDASGKLRRMTAAPVTFLSLNL